VCFMEEFEQLCLWKEYEPEVDDYVRWDKSTSMNVDEGWVYFKCNQYITIETGVRPRPSCDCTNGKKRLHYNIHTLLLCHNEQWGQLEYIKKRENKHI